jgi:hypothetical protein
VSRQFDRVKEPISPSPIESKASVLRSLQFVAGSADSAFSSTKPDSQVAPVSDWRERRSETGATFGCGPAALGPDSG